MKKNLLKRLLSYIFKNKALFIVVVISSVFYALLTLLSPLLIGNSIDMILSASFSSFLTSLLFLLASYIFLFLFDFLLTFSSTKLATMVSKILRIEMFHQLIKLPFSYLDRTPPGEITNHFSIDTDNIMNGIIQSLPRLIIGLATILISIFVMFYLNRILASILIITAPIMYYLSKFITLNTNRFYISRTNLTSHLNSYAEEITSGIKTIKNFSYELNAKNKFEKQNQQVRSFSLKASFYSSLSHPITRLVSNSGYILVGVMGAYLASKGKLSIGEISTFLLYTTIFTRPFSEITSVVSELQLSLASAKRIFDFLDQKSEIDSGKLIPATFEGNIEFRNVNFSYRKDSPFITNFNLVIPKGTTTAIVGKTGSGKTTIFNLLMRFYEIQDGAIYIRRHQYFGYSQSNS